MGQFSVEKSFLPGQLSVEINKHWTGSRDQSATVNATFW
jgi:hypothetical protein